MTVRIAFFPIVLLILMHGLAGCGPLHPGDTKLKPKEICTTRTDFQIYRLINPRKGTVFYAVGLRGSFKVYTQSGSPMFAMTAPSTAAAPQPQPLLSPSTTPSDDGIPRIDLINGWVLLIGDDPVCTTNSVEAGADGCEVLLRRDGDDYSIFFKSALFDSVKGYVKSLDGHGLMDQSNVKHHHKILYRNVGPEPLAVYKKDDLYKESDPDAIGFKQGRDAWNHRTEN